MGISYSANVVCGFKIEIVDVEKETTKFNENTGEPYPVMTYSHTELRAGKMVYKSDDPDRFCTGETIDGLKIFEEGYEDGQKCLGVSVAYADDDGKLPSFDGKIPEAVANSELAKAIPPTFFLVLSCG